MPRKKQVRQQNIKYDNQNTKYANQNTKYANQNTKYAKQNTKYVNLYSKILIYAVLSQDNFCREFTYFFGVPFTGLKNMVAYQK